MKFLIWQNLLNLKLPTKGLCICAYKDLHPNLNSTNFTEWVPFHQREFYSSLYCRLSHQSMWNVTMKVALWLVMWLAWLPSFVKTESSWYPLGAAVLIVTVSYSGESWSRDAREGKTEIERYKMYSMLCAIATDVLSHFSMLSCISISPFLSILHAKLHLYLPPFSMLSWLHVCAHNNIKSI